MIEHPDNFVAQFSDTSDRQSAVSDAAHHGHATHEHMTGSAPNSTDGGGLRVAIIERRSFVRECLIRSLSQATGWNVLAYDSAGAWLAVAERLPVSLVVLCVGGANAATADTENDGYAGFVGEISALAPVAMMADSEEPADIVAALERNVRGYIPNSLPLAVAVEAMRLVRAGGVYVPASSLIAAQKSLAEPHDDKPKATSMFTSRQLSVIAALRKGKANKIIAFELQMRESTVKVHVRNIMKKLKARNRTEVAYLANSMLASDQR